MVSLWWTATSDEEKKGGLIMRKETYSSRRFAMTISGFHDNISSLYSILAWDGERGPKSN